MKEFFNMYARPEIDTIRLYLKVDLSRVHLDAWFEREFVREICTLEAEKDEEGGFVYEGGRKKLCKTWARQRLDMRFSSFSKMQIFEQFIERGRSVGQLNYIPVICVEYSVPKFYAHSNGVNRGVPAEVAGVADFLEPCFQALKALNFYSYSEDTEEVTNQKIRDHFEIRRLDLSYNFKVSDVRQALVHLSACRLPKQAAKTEPVDEQDEKLNFCMGLARGDFSSVTFGGGKGSSYKIQFYNKALEQKKLFQTFEQDLSYICRQEKKNWYNENKWKFDGIVRFEVQFHHRFFVYHIPESKIKGGSDMANKIIMLSAVKWRDILQKFDEQLNCLGHHDPKEIDRAAEVCELLETKQLLGELSNTQAANLKDFVKRCHGLGYQNVQKTMSQQLFSNYYCRLKKLTGFDVKTMCLEALPIMRNMHTRSYMERSLENLYFDVTNYEVRAAI